MKVLMYCRSPNNHMDKPLEGLFTGANGAKLFAGPTCVPGDLQRQLWHQEHQPPLAPCPEQRAEVGCDPHSSSQTVAETRSGRTGWESWFCWLTSPKTWALCGWEAYGRASLWVCTISLSIKPYQCYTKSQVSKELLHSHLILIHKVQRANWSNMQPEDTIVYMMKTSSLCPAMAFQGSDQQRLRLLTCQGRAHGDTVNTFSEKPHGAYVGPLEHIIFFYFASTMSTRLEVSYRAGCAAGMLGSLEPGAPAPSKGICLLLPASYLVLFKRRLKPGQITVSRAWLRQDLSHWTSGLLTVWNYVLSPHWLHEMSVKDAATNTQVHPLGKRCVTRRLQPSPLICEAVDEGPGVSLATLMAPISHQHGLPISRTRGR